MSEEAIREKVKDRQRKWREANPEKVREYYEANREKRKEYTRKWREANPEYGRKYREANAEKVKKVQRKWSEANAEKEKERNRKWREANPEKEKESQRKYREANPEKVKESNRKYREANLEKVKENNRKWREANPEKVKEMHSRRRASKRGVENTLTAAEYEQILADHNYRCHYGAHHTGKLTQDHKVPLYNGGGHTKENVVPACSRCNSEKGAMSYSDFVDLLRSRDELRLVL